MKRQAKMAIQKSVGGVMVLLAIFGIIWGTNPVLIIAAAAIGVAFLISRRIIFEI